MLFNEIKNETRQKQKQNIYPLCFFHIVILQLIIACLNGYKQIKVDELMAPFYTKTRIYFDLCYNKTSHYGVNKQKKHLPYT